MNAEQFRAALDVLGLKQTGSRGADKFLGVGPVTIRRWAMDSAQTNAGEIPESVAMLLTLMIAKRIKPARMREMLDGLDALLAREADQDSA
jgi:hypothetical protein